MKHQKKNDARPGSVFRDWLRSTSLAALALFAGVLCAHGNASAASYSTTTIAGVTVRPGHSGSVLIQGSDLPASCSYGFAYDGTDRDVANMFLSVALGAQLSGAKLQLWYTPSSCAIAFVQLAK